jgi:ATP cone domain
MARLRKVRARNGDIVPFSQGRVAESIREAVGVCGMEDAVLADELASVVVLFLEKHYDDENPPGIDDIREMIGKVLEETGHVRISRAYLRLSGLPVHEVGAADTLLLSDPVESSIEGLARSRQGVVWLEVIDTDDGLPNPWSLDRLARSIERDLVVGEVEARELALEVEARILDSGLSWLDAALVREFVDVELAARGHHQLLRRHRLAGVSRREIESWLFPGDGPALDPEAACGERVLSHYAREEIHSRAVGRAHIEGRLHLLGLGRPQRVERVALDSTGPLFPACESTTEFLLGLVTLLQSIGPLVRDDVLLTRFSESFSRIKKAPVSQKRVSQFVGRLADHLERVDVYGGPIFPRITLEIHLTGDHLAGESEEAQRVRALARALLDHLQVQPKFGQRLGLVFVLSAVEPYDWPDSELLAQLLQAARSRPGVALELLRDRADAEEGSRHPSRDAARLDVGAVAVNVPLALSLAEVSRPEEITRALSGAFGLATDALFEKYWFLRRSAPATLRGLMGRLPGGRDLEMQGASQAGRILFWGLPQAVRWLEARGVAQPSERAEILARILGAAEYFAGEERESIRLDVELGGVVERDVRDRLLAATERRSGEDPHLAAVLAGFADDGSALPLGASLLDPVNAPLLASRHVERLGPGMELPARGEDEIAGGRWLGRLFETTNLRRLQFETDATYFERQESLFADGSA